MVYQLKLFDQNPSSLGAFHFIGIGGAGMGALAQVLHTAGFSVQGSDQTSNSMTQFLQNQGLTIYEGHHADNIGSATMVITNSAINSDNPEILTAKAEGLTVLHRADVLAEIAKHYYTVGIAGTHGKTTTTAMAYEAFKAAGVDVGVINGSALQALGGQSAMLPENGDGILVIELDESDKSFLKFHPHVAVILNIEPEHLENFDGPEGYVAAFQQFANQAKEGVVMNADCPISAQLAYQIESEAVQTSLDAELGADVYPLEAPTPQVAEQARGMLMDVHVRGGKLDDVRVNAFGVHNASNALSVLAAGSILQIPQHLMAEGLSTFQGTQRRFEKLGTLAHGPLKGADVFDDYAHHPTEIVATLEGAKQLYETVIAVVQPHQFTRLRDNFADFAKSTRIADATIVLPVYAARSEPIEGITHETLAKEMSIYRDKTGGNAPVSVAENTPETALDALNNLTFAQQPSAQRTCVLFMGAGDSRATALGLCS